MNNKKKLHILIILFTLVVLLISFFSFKTYHKYQLWSKHKSYFEQDESKQKIEEWMSIRFIEHHFDIDMNERLNLDLHFFEKSDSLLNLCIEQKLDCKKIMAMLNKK